MELSKRFGMAVSEILRLTLSVITALLGAAAGAVGGALVYSFLFPVQPADISNSFAAISYTPALHVMQGLVSLPAAIGFMTMGMICAPARLQKYMLWVFLISGAVLAILPLYSFSTICTSFLSTGCDAEFHDQAGEFLGFPWGAAIGTYGGGALYLLWRIRCRPLR